MTSQDLSEEKRKIIRLLDASPWEASERRSLIEEISKCSDEEIKPHREALERIFNDMKPEADWLFELISRNQKDERDKFDPE